MGRALGEITVGASSPTHAEWPSPRSFECQVHPSSADLIAQRQDTIALFGEQRVAEDQDSWDGLEPRCRAIHDSRSLLRNRHSFRYRTADRTHVNATRRNLGSARRRSMTSSFVIRSLSSDTAIDYLAITTLPRADVIAFRRLFVWGRTSSYGMVEGA